MQPADIRSELHILQEELVSACEENDWALVEEVDEDIFALMESVDPALRLGELADSVAQLKQTYEQIFSRCRLRRKELQGKMTELRRNKSAIAGYKTSLAAGNKEIRKNA